MKNKPFLFLLIIFLILSLIFSLSSFFAFYEVAVEKKLELYPFGTEGSVAGLWQYKNSNNYIIYNLVLGFLWTLVSIMIVISLIKKNFTLGKYSIIFAIIVYSIGRIIENF